MKEKSVYKREYKEKEISRYTKLIEYLKNNFSDNLIFTNPEISGKTYMGFEDKNLIIIHQANLSKMYTRVIKHQANISIEKVGEDVDKESEIEKLLVKEGFEKTK